MGKFIERISSPQPRAAIQKPAKPRPDFPLFAHATRRWAKKIRDKMHYFGPRDNPQAAEDKYLKEREYLHAGRTPPQQTGELTIRDLLNHFLTTKRHLVEAGELAERTWSDYYSTCERIKKAFGETRLVSDLRGDDFAAMRVAMTKRGRAAVAGHGTPGRELRPRIRPCGQNSARVSIFRLHRNP